MLAKKLSRRGLSREAKLSETAVRDVLDRTENPGIGTLQKIADALELPFDALTGAATVKLLGRVGAGGAILLNADDDDPHADTVPRPPMIFGRLMALEVVGDSQLPKFDAGDIVYVRRDHEGVLPRYFGDYCAVRTSDGGTWLKVLSPGTAPGRFTLRSLNAADMPDVEVEWASPVLFIMPRAARQ